MVSSINFTSQTHKGYIGSNGNDKGERVVIMEKKPDGFFRTSMKSAAYIKKAYVTTKEGIFGAVSAVFSGLVAGGSVMGLDWLIQRASGHGVKNQSAILTPIKTGANIVIGAAKKFFKVFSKDTSMSKVLAYPFVGFPRDVYKYVKSAKGGTTAGKYIAVAVGLGAVAFSALKTLIKINRLNAEVDHGFKVGHNK